MPRPSNPELWIEKPLKSNSYRVFQNPQRQHHQAFDLFHILKA
jgi:hypothetical protein